MEKQKRDQGYKRRGLGFLALPPSSVRLSFARFPPTRRRGVSTSATSSPWTQAAGCRLYQDQRQAGGTSRRCKDDGAASAASWRQLADAGKDRFGGLCDGLTATVRYNTFSWGRNGAVFPCGMDNNTAFEERYIPILIVSRATQNSFSHGSGATRW